MEAQANVLYTGDDTQLMDHGGFGTDSRNVGLIISHPNIVGLPGIQAGSVARGATSSLQLAPTILNLLGIDYTQLQALKYEDTKPLTLSVVIPKPSGCPPTKKPVHK